MANFTPRLTAPATDDKNWIKTTFGGKNKCIHDNTMPAGSVLPNCVGWVHGRWLELMAQQGISGYPTLCLGNAESYYGFKDGYKRGSTPKLGAIVCNSGNGSLAGHVMIVEQINSDGSILVSESTYSSTGKGKRFGTRKLKKPYSIGSSYPFQGFIYFPIELELVSMPKPVTADTSAKQVEVITATLNVRSGAGKSNPLLVSGKYCPKGYYNIVSEKIADSYLWHEIEPGKWIASGPSWTILHDPVVISPPTDELNRKLVDLIKQIHELTNL